MKHMVICGTLYHHQRISIWEVLQFIAGPGLTLFSSWLVCLAIYQKPYNMAVEPFRPNPENAVAEIARVLRLVPDGDLTRLDMT